MDEKTPSPLRVLSESSPSPLRAPLGWGGGSEGGGGRALGPGRRGTPGVRAGGWQASAPSTAAPVEQIPPTPERPRPPCAGCLGPRPPWASSHPGARPLRAVAPPPRCGAGDLPPPRRGAWSRLGLGRKDFGLRLGLKSRIPSESSPSPLRVLSESSPGPLRAPIGCTGSNQSGGAGG